MTLPENQNSAPFVLKLKTLWFIFELVPWYSTEENRLIKPTLFKWYSSIVVVVVSSLILWLIYIRYQIVYGQIITIYLVCDFLPEVEALVMIIIIILKTTYGNMNICIDLCHLSRRVGVRENFLWKREKRVFILRRDKHIFILGNIFILFIYLVNFSVMSTIIDGGIHVLFSFMASFLLYYYEFLVAYIIVNILGLIKYRYMPINKLFTVCHFNNIDFIKHVRDVKEVWLKMDGVIEVFNWLFGWPLLLIFFNSFFYILKALIESITKNVDRLNQVYAVYVMVISVLYLLQSVVWLTAIIFGCDLIEREAEKLLSHCYRLEQALPVFSKEMEDLNGLKKLIMYKSPKITAAGFFEIRRTTLLSLFGIVTTYFIVALQLNLL